MVTYNPSNPPPPPPPPPKSSTQNMPQQFRDGPTLPPYNFQGQHLHELEQSDWEGDIQGRAGARQGHRKDREQDGQQQYQQQQQHHQQQVPLPAEGWVPHILSDKLKPDLSHLLHNPTLQHALLHSPNTAHPSLTASQTPLLPLLTTNIALSHDLLHLSTTLTYLRSHVTSHLLSVRALEQTWKARQASLETKLEPWGPRSLHERLGREIMEQEATCRGVEESFLSGDGELVEEREVVEWVRRIREGRRMCALRKERKGRWDEGRVGGWR